LVTVKQVIGDLIFAVAFVSIWVYACLETGAPIEMWIIGLGIFAFVFTARIIKFMKGEL